MTKLETLQLKLTATRVRMGVIEATHGAGCGHPGGSLSAADVLTYLYFREMRIDPDAVCSCTKKCEAGAVNTACPVCVTDKSKCTGKAPEPPAETPEPEKEKPAGLNPAALILLLALLGGGGVFAYLKLVKNKPKTKGNDSLDDYDYGEEDSEEWETEDEEVLEDGFEGSDPNEERDRAD